MAEYGRDGKPILVRTPSQASRIFGLDQDAFYGDSSGGNHIGVPRPKFLFVVRFVRGAGEGNAKWRDGLSMAVKNMDRPAVTPVVQTMNQYNKKRLVNTGINFQPVTIEFHDTTDSIAYSVWHEYASYYFGDFSRETDFDWKYDVTTGQFYDTGGFGVILPPLGNSPLESSYFFEKIECYQFSGGEFIQFDLIHPKITAFSPDNMEYDNPGSNTIRMTFDYESVIYHNQLMPVPMSSSNKVMELYGMQLNGNVYEPEGSYNRSVFGDLNNRASSINNVIRSIGRLTGNEKLAGTEFIPDNITQGLGVLSSFGVFDFGGGVSQMISPITGALQNIAGRDFSEYGLGSTQARETYIRGIGAQQLDVAAAQAQKNLKPNGVNQESLAMSYAVADMTNKPVMSVINSNRPQSSQIGTRTPKETEKPRL